MNCKPVAKEGQQSLLIVEEKQSATTPPAVAVNADAVKPLLTNRPVPEIMRRWRRIGLVVLVIYLGLMTLCTWATATDNNSWWAGLVVALSFVLIIPLLITCLMCRLTRHANYELSTTGPAVSSDPSYKNATLLQKAAALGPYNSPPCVFYQPVEGYCGHSTLNTVLWSLSKRNDPCEHGVPLPRSPRPFSLASLASLIQTSVMPKCSAIESVQIVSGDVSRTDFAKLMLLANDPKTRLLCNFHRTPLFFSNRSKCGRYKKFFSGHWVSNMPVLFANLFTLFVLILSCGCCAVSPLSELTWKRKN